MRNTVLPSGRYTKVVKGPSETGVVFDILITDETVDLDSLDFDGTLKKGYWKQRRADISSRD